MHKIEAEMKAAQHLLYVSLKYTKTGDVILNLITRWEAMIGLAIDKLLLKAKKKKLIKEIPTTPKPRVEALEKVFKKEPLVLGAMKLYSFFRKIPSSKIVREHEFRKNITLRVINKEEVAIDLEKLKEWQELLESFIKFVQAYVGK